MSRTMTTFSETEIQVEIKILVRELVGIVSRLRKPVLFLKGSHTYHEQAMISTKVGRYLVST